VCVSKGRCCCCLSPKHYIARRRHVSLAWVKKARQPRLAPPHARPPARLAPRRLVFNEMATSESSLLFFSVRGRMNAVTVDVFDFHNDSCHEFGLAHWNKSCENFVNRREASFLSEMMTACLETTKKCFNSLQCVAWIVLLPECLSRTYLAAMRNEEEGYPQATTSHTCLTDCASASTQLKRSNQSFMCVCIYIKFNSHSYALVVNQVSTNSISNHNYRCAGSHYWEAVSWADVCVMSILDYLCLCRTE
jgi:hypothetical protein